MLVRTIDLFRIVGDAFVNRCLIVFGKLVVKFDLGFLELGVLRLRFMIPMSNSQATEERFKNKGAYIVLEPPNFDTPTFHSFDAVTPRPKVNLPTDSGERISNKTKKMYLWKKI